MSQHDMVVANDTGAAVRADLNSALAALVSCSSGASAPATTFAYMLWADTANGLLKMRNGANSAWVTLGDLTAGFLSLSGGTLTSTLTLQALLDISHASAGQIKFPATQNASSNANTLDDYEEGTWTPALSASSGAATYNTQAGTYVKIGNLVTVNFWIYVLDPNTLSGNLTITGLPFAKDSSNTRPAAALRVNVVTLTGQCYGWIADGATSATLLAINNGTPSALAHTALAGNSEIDGTFSYQV